MRAASTRRSQRSATSARYTELCDISRFDGNTERANSHAELLDLALDVLMDLPGGLRPPDNDIDNTKRRLEDLCRQAKTNTPRLTTDTPQSWGTKVHAEFRRLIDGLGDSRLFSETGYLNNTTVQPNGVIYPRGTTVPDAVLGPSQLNPKAIFDLKKGISGIREVWETNLRANLPVGYNNIPVLEIRC